MLELREAQKGGRMANIQWILDNIAAIESGATPTVFKLVPLVEVDDLGDYQWWTSLPKRPPPTPEHLSTSSQRSKKHSADGESKSPKPGGTSSATGRGAKRSPAATSAPESGAETEVPTASRKGKGKAKEQVKGPAKGKGKERAADEPAASSGRERGRSTTRNPPPAGTLKSSTHSRTVAHSLYSRVTGWSSSQSEEQIPK